MTPPLAEEAGGSRCLKFHEFLLEFARGYLHRFAESMPLRLRQILGRILLCRTTALGGSLFRCPECSDLHYQYHSCNNRHCAQCGHADAEQWLARQRQRLLLPVSYFMVTFTVPEALRYWIRSHMAEGLDTLFAASSRSLQDLAANPRRLSAQLGMLGVLHTWARTLIFHPHVHYLIPGGGLSPDGRRWVAAKSNYFLNVQALGAHYRTLFKELLQKEHPELFEQIPVKVWKQSWVVHSLPVGSGENALRYLSRYIFKTATSNRPVHLLANGKVRWSYRESNTARHAHVDLKPDQLISRFLQHVLPKGYCRVRLFGWLHPAAKVRANRVRALLKQAPVLSEEELRIWEPPLPDEDLSPDPESEQPPPTSLPMCPRCAKPMELLGRWKPGHSPLVPIRCRSP